MLPSCLKSLVRDLGKTGVRGVSKKLNAAHQVETAFGHDEYSCAFFGHWGMLDLQLEQA